MVVAGLKTEVGERRSENGGQRKKKVAGLKVESQRSKMKTRIHPRSTICDPRSAILHFRVHSLEVIGGGFASGRLCRDLGELVRLSFEDF